MFEPLSAIVMKMLRDLYLFKGRSLLVVLSIAISTFTLGVIFSSYDILSREMNDNFLHANPTELTFYSDTLFDETTTQSLRAHPLIDKVEPRRSVSGEIKNADGQSFPLTLFVLNDYEHVQLDIVRPVSGAWPPALGQILIEQQALSVLQVDEGERVTVQRQVGTATTTEFVVAGAVHDVVQPQAQWENHIYGYVSMGSLELMGGLPGFNQLKLSHRDTGQSQQALEQFALTLMPLINKSGYAVDRVHVPEPGRHPHANITSGMFMIQKVFAILCCLLSGILVYNLVSAILSKQRPQIGVMKALGAQPRHLRAIYYGTIILLSSLGLMVSLPLGYLVSMPYVDMIAAMMNITIESYAISPWIIVLQLCLGLGIPLLSALLPIRKASRVSVRESLIGNEPRRDCSPKLLAGLFSSSSILSVSSQFGLRNAVRAKERFILSGIVLCIGGTLLMAAFNISETMNQSVSDNRASNQWDVSLQFRQPVSVTTVDELLSSVNGLAELESFSRMTGRIMGRSILIPQSMSVVGLKDGSQALRLPMMTGQWLSKQADDIVVSQLLAKQYPNIAIGDELRIEIAGEEKTFTLKGVASFVGPATMFVNRKGLGHNGSKANSFFVRSEDEAGLSQIQMSHITEVLSDAGLQLKRMTRAEDATQVVANHFKIIFSLLMLLTVIVLFIAGNGIILTVTTNTLERTREIGILKSIGASNRNLRQIFLSESILMALLAWLMAVVLTIPLSYCVAHFLGILLIQTPLPLALDSTAFLFSLPVIVLVSVLSTLIPVARVCKQPIRESLAYE